MQLGRTRSDRKVFVHPEVLLLLTASLCGAFVGALASRWITNHCADAGGFRFLRPDGSFLRQLPNAFLFPMLLLLADLSERKIGFLAVFFCRGAAVSCVVCAALSCLSPNDSRLLIQYLTFRCLLPLPVFFFCAGRLMRSASIPKENGRTLLIFFPFAAELAALICEFLLQG